MIVFVVNEIVRYLADRGVRVSDSFREEPFRDVCINCAIQSFCEFIQFIRSKFGSNLVNPHYE